MGRIHCKCKRIKILIKYGIKWDKKLIENKYFLFEKKSKVKSKLLEKNNDLVKSIYETVWWQSMVFN